jgi:manganese/zinc/iron transport system permease protein
MDLWQQFLSNYTLRTVALGAAALGTVSGALGAFAVLRKQSLLGDAVSHAALPGIALAFLVTHSKAPLVLAVGAALAGWAATLVVLAVVRHSRVPYDSALGMALSVFFGFGLVLLTWMQKRPDASQAGLDKYLFGQAATLLAEDVRTMAGLGAVAVAVLAAFWKEFKLLSFDPDFAASLGLPVRGLDILLTSLLVVAVVLGLQCVGVVLMSALVVAPAAAARQWTDRLGVMVLLSAAFGGVSGLVGTVLSDALSSPGKPMPTGPTIVLVATAVVLASLAWKGLRAVHWSRPAVAP